MPKKHSKAGPRKPRTDAARNRERILEVAKEAFTRNGADASLDEIAKQAEVGAGTLYRHFPNRDDLIEAVYKSEVEKIAAAGRRLAEDKAPLEALRAWMLMFVDHIAAKLIIAPALNSIVGGPGRLYEGSRGQVQEVVELLVKRAVKSGEMRKDVDAFDLMRALIGMAYVQVGPDWKQSARRLVDVLIAGSRPVK
jgi:AcrR family transcriptional regulator